MTNPALDAMLAALDAGKDMRLLVPALDLCQNGDETRNVLARAGGAQLDALDEASRVRVAQAALEGEQWDLAARAASGIEEALAVQVEALLALEDAGEAQARYHAAVADNPTLEDPKLLERIKAALDQMDAPSNVLAFNTRGGGNPVSTGPLDQAELDHARLSHLESHPDAGTIRFKDVGGHGAVKKQIDRRIIAPFRKPALFARFRRKSGGGVMLYGPPGCGKTLLARATAGECEARFINVAVTDVLDKYIGEPERKLAAIFEDARRETPCVLFFDEIEALAAKRGTSSTNHEMATVSTFLAELDGFAQNNEGVLILAATNMPWAVDPAFRRSGRFDRMLFVPPPDREARAEILRLQLDGRPGSEALDLNKIAAKLSGYSGADIQNLVDTAADLAIEASIDAGDEMPITGAHLEEAMGEVRATTAEWLTTARNFAKYGNSGGQYDEVADFIARHGK